LLSRACEPSIREQLGQEPGKLDIFPSANELPANTSRFHIVSDCDMRNSLMPGDVSLSVDSQVGGANASRSFGSTNWSEDGQRLTLHCDVHPVRRRGDPPGDNGPHLIPGLRYVMSVRDRSGRDIRSSLKVVGFKAVEAEHRSLDSSLWKLVLPAIETRRSVHLRFDRPMDRMSLLAGVSVIDDRGHVVDGALQCGSAETSIDFVPDRKWSGGEFHLQLSALIEDVCGNRFEKLPGARVRKRPNATSDLCMRFHLS
jgi:hypothetical protein